MPRSPSGGAGEFYQQGLYKQGWALFKQNLNHESLPLFARLLDVKLRDDSAPRGYASAGDTGTRRPRARWMTRCA